MSVSEMNGKDTGEFSLQLHLSRFLFHLQSLVSQDQQQWIVNAISEVQKETNSIDELANRVISFTARARRCLGEQTLTLKLPAYDASRFTGLAEWTASHWSKADLARLVLVGSALHTCMHDKYLTFEKIYSFCDANERRSLLNGIFWLLDDERVVEFAEDVQRTNDLDLFAALIAENPFPAVRYEETAFNQLVLKSLFLGVAIDRISGLQYRMNKTLNRMCDDYLHERRLAGREIPATLWLGLCVSNVSNETQAAWIAALASDNDDQRYYSLKALVDGQARGDDLPASLMTAVDKRRSAEQHPVILALVQDMQFDTI